MTPETDGRTLQLVVFDLDGTLLEEESSWGIVNQYFGNENAADIARWRRGEIDFAELMRRDIAAWPRPLHIAAIREALAGFSLRPGAAAAVAALRDRGLAVAILSGGIQVLADAVAAQLGIAEALANEIVTDARGFVTGEVRMHVDPLRKERALARFCAARGVVPEQCVAVGDSELDRSFLHAAGLGVLVGDARTGEALGVASVPGLSDLVAVVDRARAAGDPVRARRGAGTRR